MAMTEPEEKNQRHLLMQARGIGELEAAFDMTGDLNRCRGIEPLVIDLPGTDQRPCKLSCN
ncbi:hypothetical protein D3C84_464720 [compost metagenome]